MMPFLKRLADPNIRDVRKYLSKVIDITEGTKTPIFNKRKAHQLIQLMEKSNFEPLEKSHTKPDLL